jgi:hypothetical protein
LELSRQLQTFDPDAATRQLSQISDASSRGALIQELGKMWKLVDPTRGESLLLASATSDAERRQIIAKMEGR